MMVNTELQKLNNSEKNVWLNYYNDYLKANGVISETEYIQIRNKINIR